MKRKKKKYTVKIDGNEIKVRIPIPRTGHRHKDKSKYDRKKLKGERYECQDCREEIK